MGDLHSYLMNDKNVFTVKMTHGYAKQIASAMNYLEDKRMLHRDLAVRNILVYTKDMVSVERSNAFFCMSYGTYALLL